MNQSPIPVNMPKRTILLLRHAERLSSPPDNPALSPAGEQRARDLVSAVGNAGIKTIFTTQYVRSVQTAQPLADHLAITPTQLGVDPFNPQAYVQDLIAHIRLAPSRASVLVVSHSNTIPMIVAALRTAVIGPIDEDEFDKLFIIETLGRPGKARIVRARYGAPSATG